MQFSITQLLFATALFGIIVSFCTTSHFNPKVVSLVTSVAFLEDGGHLAVLRLDGQDAGVAGKAYVNKFVSTLSIKDLTLQMSLQWQASGFERVIGLVERARCWRNSCLSIGGMRYSFVTLECRRLTSSSSPKVVYNISPTRYQTLRQLWSVGKSPTWSRQAARDHVDVFIPGDKSSLCSINTKLGDQWRLSFCFVFVRRSHSRYGFPRRSRLLELEQRNAQNEFKPFRSRSEITNIAFSTCDNTLAIAEKGRLVLYDPARGQGRFMYDDLPNGRLVFSSDGKWLAGITDARQSWWWTFARVRRSASAGWLPTSVAWLGRPERAFWRFEPVPNIFRFGTRFQWMIRPPFCSRDNGAMDAMVDVRVDGTCVVFVRLWRILDSTQVGCASPPSLDRRNGGGLDSHERMKDKAESEPWFAALRRGCAGRLEVALNQGGETGMKRDTTDLGQLSKG